MSHFIKTGTDGATLCCFDAAALPDDFDSLMKEDAIKVWESSMAQGRFWWHSTDGDGAYLFQIFTDELVPERIRSACRDPETITPFEIPSGKLWACGAEYAAKDPARGGGNGPGGLNCYAHMGGCCEIPPGAYAATFWRTEWPDDAEDEMLKSRLGAKTSLLTTVLGVSTVLLGLTALIALGVLGALSLRSFTVTYESPAWLIGPWLGWFGLVALGYVILRFLRRSEAHPARTEIARLFPSIVVQLKRLQ